MGLNTKKLVQLTEQCAADGSSFASKWREQLGVVEATDSLGRRTKRLDKGKGAIDARNVSIQEIYRAFSEAAGVESITEAAVLPSTFAHISGFDMSIAGLLDALVLEGYQAVEFIGKEMIGTQEWKINGGKKIRIANDGVILGEVGIGMPLPEVGLKENWITLPPNKRWGRSLSINKLDYIYDRTGIIQEKAQQIGYATGFEIEQQIAALVLGITNSYSMNDTTGNTYLATVGANPMNYVNSVANVNVADWKDINTAYMIMQANTDPNTGYPIQVPMPKIWTMPQQYLNMRSVLFPTGAIQQYSAAPGTATTRTTYSNPLPFFGIDSIQMLSFIWYNLSVATAANGGEAQSTTYAPFEFLMGQPDRAFKWMQVQPFTSWTAPITAYEQSRGTANIYMCEEVGVPVVIEPRYIYRSKRTS